MIPSRGMRVFDRGERAGRQRPELVRETVLRIRDETSGDRQKIFAVHAAAFPTDDEARLVDRLRSSGDLAVSLVAEAGGEIVGHVAFSRMSAPIRALGLAPVAVLPSRQNEGVGSALIREGLARAGKKGWQAVFVLGDNAYYERFGFSAQAASGFSCSYAGPHFMALGLAQSGLPQSTGNVAYAAAFDALG